MAQYVELLNVMTLTGGIYDFRIKGYMGRLPRDFLYQSPDGLIRIGFERFSFENELARELEDFMGGKMVLTCGVFGSVINILLSQSLVSWRFHISLNLRYYDGGLMEGGAKFDVEELAFFISEYFYEGYGISNNFSDDSKSLFCCCKGRVN